MQKINRRKLIIGIGLATAGILIVGIGLVIGVSTGGLAAIGTTIIL